MSGPVARPTPAARMRRSTRPSLAPGGRSALVAVVAGSRRGARGRPGLQFGPHLERDRRRRERRRPVDGLGAGQRRAGHRGIRQLQDQRDAVPASTCTSASTCSEGQLLATLDPTSAQLTVDQAQLSLTRRRGPADRRAGRRTRGSGSGSASSTARRSVPAVDATEFVLRRRPRRATAGPTPDYAVLDHDHDHAVHDSDEADRSATSVVLGRDHPRRATRTLASTSRRRANATTTTPRRRRPPSPRPRPRSTAPSSTCSNAQPTLAETRLVRAGRRARSFRSRAPAPGTRVGRRLVELIGVERLRARVRFRLHRLGLGSGTGARGQRGAASAARARHRRRAARASREIVDTGSMTMTVAFSESDITKVKVGQPATVTLDALTGRGARRTRELDLHVRHHQRRRGQLRRHPDLDQTDSQRPARDERLGLGGHRAGPGGQPPQQRGHRQRLGDHRQPAQERQDRSRPRWSVGLRGDSRTQIVSGLRAGPAGGGDHARSRRWASAAGVVSATSAAGSRARAALRERRRWLRRRRWRLGGGGARLLRRRLMDRAPGHRPGRRAQDLRAGRDLGARAARNHAPGRAAASTWRSWAARAAARAR